MSSVLEVGMPPVELSQELLQVEDSLAVPREEGIALVVDSQVVLEEDSQAVQEEGTDLEVGSLAVLVGDILEVREEGKPRRSDPSIQVDSPC